MPSVDRGPLGGPDSPTPDELVRERVRRVEQRVTPRGAEARRDESSLSAPGVAVGRENPAPDDFPERDVACRLLRVAPGLIGEHLPYVFGLVDEMKRSACHRQGEAHDRTAVLGGS
jgi:hypothetical protein